MTKIEHILFPVDFSPHCLEAAPYVRTLATRTGARVTMLHVVQLPPFWFGGGQLTSVGPHIDFTEIKRQRQEHLNGFLRQEFEGMRVLRLLAEGEAAGVITQLAEREGAHLIMMPTRGYGVFRRFLLGSVTAKVLHDASCPVWTNVHREEVQTPENPSWRRMLCALDLEDGSIALLRWAIDFAASQGATLEVVHVEPAVEEESQNRGAIEIRRYFYSQARERWAEIQKELGLASELLLAGGSVGAAVRRTALKCNSDLVVIGRGRLKEPLAGMRSEAYGIVRESPCPVLSV